MDGRGPMSRPYHGSDGGGSCVVSVPEDDGTEVHPLGGEPNGGGGSNKASAPHSVMNSPSGPSYVLKGGGAFAEGGRRGGGGFTLAGLVFIKHNPKY